MPETYTCIIVDDESFATKIMIDLVDHVDSLQLLQTCADATEAFNVLNSK